ncbi:MAG: hypothetical protein HW401_593 [Parcubacteria group bacterium]|nr:hypothetical protein [Parcubacteria group bacterium]
MKNQDSEISDKDDARELINTLNKVIYDVNLLIEKVRPLEEFKKFADREIFEVRADVVDLKSDDLEIKKNLSLLNQEVKKIEHEIIKLNERVLRLENKTKSL